MLRIKMTTNKRKQMIVCLCNDIMVDIIHLGKRRQLGVLEEIARRFHHLIDKIFVKKPFLVFYARTNFYKRATFFRHILSAPGVDNKPDGNLVRIINIFRSENLYLS